MELMNIEIYNSKSRGKGLIHIGVRSGRALYKEGYRTGVKTASNFLMKEKKWLERGWGKCSWFGKKDRKREFKVCHIKKSLSLQCEKCEGGKMFSLMKKCGWGTGHLDTVLRREKVNKKTRRG